MATTPATARLVEVDYPGATCQPNGGWGRAPEACPGPPRFVAFHTPRGTSPGPVYGAHPALCHQHARELIARCLRWECTGAS